MSNCLSFILENPTFERRWLDWARSLSVLFGIEEKPNTSPCTLLHARASEGQGEEHFSDSLLQHLGIHVVRKRSLHAGGVNDYDAGVAKPGNTAKDDDDAWDAKPGNVPKAATHRPSQSIEIMKQENTKCLTNNHSQLTETMKINGRVQQKRIPKTITNGGDDIFSVFIQQGLKGTNQDSMIVWEDFIPSENSIICGVFDGHGPHGHHISRNVRDTLPLKIASCWQALQVSSLLARSKSGSFEKHAGLGGNLGSDLDRISLWEETFHNAFKLMDKELLVDEDVDCVFSGTTAVTLVKQGNDLIIANVGDSRAVLGVKFDDSLLALQLTVDLTPNLPKEAERIRRCNGRVLALRKEPFVKRVWLPNENSPGLAMARAFGDYVLKNFGIISVPEVTHRRISKNDKFVVLATDGVWDVLSNEQVVRIVDSCPVRSSAAQAVVDTAVRAWKLKYPDAKTDDCAVVCLFLDNVTESWQASST